MFATLQPTWFLSKELFIWTLGCIFLQSGELKDRKHPSGACSVCGALALKDTFMFSHEILATGLCNHSASPYRLRSDLLSLKTVCKRYRHFQISDSMMIRLPIRSTNSCYSYFPRVSVVLCSSFNQSSGLTEASGIYANLLKHASSSCCSCQ